MVRRFKLLLLVIVCALFYGCLIKAALSPNLPSPEKPIILYSNQKRDDFRLVLKKSFAAATQAMTLWMYAATDPLLLRHLQKKADEGVHVTLHFDKRSGTPSLPDSLHARALKSKGLMHRKIVVIDGATVFLGSANMTSSSLQLHDNLSIGLYHSGVAQFLQSGSHGNYSFQIGTPPIQALLWLLPDLNALSELENQVDSANSSIFIAMFTLTQTDLLDALIRAHRRGVSVTLALDRYTARGASQKSVKKLLEAGVEILLSSGLPLLHHKWAYIDEKQLILGSTNWTEAAFRKNHDCLLFLTPLSPLLKQQIESIASSIRLESESIPIKSFSRFSG